MFQHELPSLKGSEEDCIANFVLRKDARFSYPGACSLEFQSIMQILTNVCLGGTLKHRQQQERAYWAQ